MKYLPNYLILSLFSFVVIFSSCSNDKTYAQLLEQEKRAIRKFMAEQQITATDISNEELEVYTDQAAWDEAENKHFELDKWYHFENGLYMKINDFGDTTQMFQSRDAIIIRFQDRYNLLTYENMESTKDDNLLPYAYWEIPYWSTNYSGTYGVGVAFPIRFLGEKSSVSLIVPSKIGAGDTYSSDLSSVTPRYYGEIIYRLSSW